MQRNRLTILAVGLTLGIGGLAFAVTSTAATRTQDHAISAAAAPAAVSAQEKAANTALAKFPGTVKKSETECEDGRLTYTFDIETANGRVKVSVDALTGVATQKVDDDDHEKGVKAGDKKDADDEEDEDDDDGGAKACSDHHDSAKTKK